MRRVVAHVFIDDLAVPRPALSDDDVHHLSRVLRLRPGEAVSVSDGQGGVQVCEWAGGAALRPVAPPVRHPRPAPLLTVGFALTKGDHPEWAVQKLTEAGADCMVVVISARCVARWPVAKHERQLARLREVARQAAMQSRRAWLPVVEGPVPFTDLVADRAPVALAVPGGRPVSLLTPTVLVGPEGGWTDEELAAVAHHVSLGPHVLRAETAAVAAGVLLAALRTGLVAEVA
jgi:16S rRNA (uracil1498-N3)-methyltransferase